MRFALLTSIFMIGAFYSSDSSAKHYNVLKLSCEISGSEVSLTPVDQPGPRIQKISYSDKIKYVVDKIVYVSDGPAAVVLPISFTTAVNEHDFPFDSPVASNEATEFLPTAFEQFLAPAQIRISKPSAQTTVTLDFSREQVIELLHAMGSPTAETFYHSSESGFASVDFLRTRYFLPPGQMKGNKPAKGAVTSSRDLPIEFTGWFGRQDLETCYQIDPQNFDAPEDLYYNGLAYHLCGSCNVDLLESSSKAFAP
ncbi:MAG: hypothetical protein U1E10_16470 [Bdellovibrionales bacterium]|nr:hypothetical protein [Bdellovibrionales bacterium]